MKARHWSLAIVLLLVNYLIFATLFTRLMETDFGATYATRTPVPTFTPAPAEPIIIVPTPEPLPPQPTPTATRVLEQSQSTQPLPQNDAPPEAAPQQAQLVAPGAVNIRSGPGINYTVIGALSANTAMPIVGRNAEGSWWQIKTPNDTRGWVANSVVNVSNAGDVPIAQAPPPPTAPVAAQPASDTSPPPPEPEQPKYQYSPTGWYDDGNAGLTRFLGDIKDASGNPVNGVFVQASCGDYSTISYPSGPVGWGSYNESGDWPPGFYDITIDTKPVPCLWTLTIVETDDRQTIKARLSEAVPVEITANKSIVTANWRKNW
ncbi:MAG: hypothetical protein Kow0031_04180 [Anaerolineae bacterium]